MGIRSKFGLSKKRYNMNSPRSDPVYSAVRCKSLRCLYSYEDFLIDLIRHCTIKQHVYHPHIPTLIVTFVPIYTWQGPWTEGEESSEVDEKVQHVMKVMLSHCNTIASNGYQKFGAVLGSKLDSRLDHIINVQLVAGVEFGVGVCNQNQVKENPRRDFMCLEGGYGYYNYKTKSAHMKPKYPPGFYFEKETCRKMRKEAEICQPGDVLTIVIQRENVMSPGGGIDARSRFGSDRDITFDPMENLEYSPKQTISFYKNGEDMGFHLRNLKGAFYLCLNFYFVESKVRLLSEYNFRKVHRAWVCRQIPGC